MMAEQDGQERRMAWRLRDDAPGQRAKPKWEILFVPILIAAVSGIITWRVETASNDNALMIAQAELASAQKIADSHIKSAQKLANGKFEREEFARSAKLFQTYYEEKSDTTKEVIVYSLSAYGRTALDFLIRIRKGLIEHVASDTTQSDASLRPAVEEAISRILTGAQPDLPGMNLRDKPFRYATLVDFNLRGADFSGANLFQANLQSSNLSDALFERSDLHGTSFKLANLTNAKFPGANLRNSDFTQAKLDGANFTGAENVGNASFSPGSLAVANFDKKDIIYLIKKYLTELRADDFHKAVLYELFKKHKIQQSEIDGVVLEEHYAAKN